MGTPTRVGSGAIADEMVLRSVEILLRQTRAGAAALTLACLLYGVVLVPAVGWGPYLAWYAVVLASLVARQLYFRHLSATKQPSRDVLRRIATWTTVTGCLPATCIPLFVQSLSLSDVGVLTVMTLGSLAAAVAVIGVQPHMYAIYQVTSLCFVYVGWLWHGDPNERVMIGLAMVLGGIMLQRAVSTYVHQLRTNVEMGLHNADLVEQLRTSLEREQDIRRARSRFLGAASHDLRQPVQALLFLSDIFRRSGDSGRREAIAQQIVRTGESIDNMFRHLVDFAQIDAGTMKADLQPVRVARLVQATVSGFGEKCAAKGLQFRLEVQAEGSVTADPVLLERLLRNFLDNACKYSLHGEIALRVRAIGEDLQIEVEDQGVGMDAEDLANVWNAFQRGRSASVAEAEGIGLGLAICRRMADLMGADLRLASTPGEGTLVTIRLPLLRQGAAASTASQRPQHLALQGRLIALLENDRLAREALTAWLQEAGATVAGGSDLAQVQQHLRQYPGPLHCVIADYRLSHGNGVDAIVALRTDHGAVPAVVVSGEPDLRDKGLDMPTLQKPVAPDALLELLLRLLPPEPQAQETP